MRLFHTAIRLRTALWLLVAACTIPAMVVATAFMWQQYRSEYGRLLERERATARAVSAIIDRDLAVVLGSLHTLRHSSSLGRDSLPAFHQQARRVLALMPSARDVYLTDSDGRLLMSTARPVGVAMPMSGNTDIARRIAATGQPHISGIFTGSLTGNRLVTVGIPADGPVAGVRHALFASLNMDDIARLLRDPALVPAGWIVSLHDRSGLFIARSHEHARFNGQPGSRDLLAAMRRQPEGVLEGTTREGIQVLAAYTRSAVSGWTVAVGVPKTQLLAGLRSNVAVAVAGVLAVLLFGLLAARMLAVRIQHAVAALIPQAERLSAWEAVTPAAGPIKELNALSQSLAQASVVLRETRHQAEHDPLTGLANRKLLMDILDFQILAARRTGLSVALLYIDLDGFKAINDLMGHRAGDDVLAATARRMKDLVRASDCAARLGGDEFVISLSESNAQHAETLARRLITEMATPVATCGGTAQIHASIGIALYPHAADNSNDLLRCADQAMYRAKARGKNRFAVYPGPS